MKHRLLLIVLASLCAVAPASGQSIRTLGFNTTNGQVVANTGTNVLTFTNAGVAFGGDMTISGPVIAGSGVSFSFEDADFAYGAPIVRVNLGFSTNLNTFWTATNSSNARSAVGLGATWLTNTNVTNFRTAIGLGATNDVEFNSVGQGGGIRMDFAAGTIYDSDPTNVVFSFASGTWYVPISFSTNTLAATTRTNLGLGLPALTNTSNITTMRALAGSTNTNQPFSGTFSIRDENSDTRDISVSNGIILQIGTPY